MAWAAAAAHGAHCVDEPLRAPSPPRAGGRQKVSFLSRLLPPAPNSTGVVTSEPSGNWTSSHGSEALSDRESVNSELHPLKRWLDQEVKHRLSSIDSRLENLMLKVEHCDRNSTNGLRELRRACEDLLGRISGDGPQGVVLAPSPFGNATAFGAPLAVSRRSWERQTSYEQSREHEERMARSSNKQNVRATDFLHQTSSSTPPAETDLLLPKDSRGRVWPAENDESGLQATPEEVSEQDPYSRSSSKDLIAQLTGRSAVSRNPYVEAVTNFLDDPESSGAARLYNRFMPRLILFTVFVTLLQSVEPNPVNEYYAMVVETCIDTFFAIEIMIRFMFSPNRRQALTSPYNFIDVLSAAPLAVRFYCGFRMPHLDTHPARYVLLCAVPVVRIVKVLRRFKQFQLLLKAFKQAFEALPVLLYTLSVIILVFSGLIYVVEPHDNVTCLPEAVWLAIVTIGTVGYGDITPVSPLGGVVVSFLIILSTLYMAMPLGIIGYTFTQIWKDKDRILLISTTRERLDQWGYSAKHIRELFKIVDDNDNGELDIDEFKDLIKKLRIGLQEQSVVMLFNFIDKDGGGTIDDEEFVRAIFPAEYQDLYLKAARGTQRVGTFSGDDYQPTKSAGSVVSDQDRRESSKQFFT
mmetsp:Transcript_169720/g.544670  ORF Transcript_169720/g.544670 Transcript_169720/m.544670 type:complete len:636 (-) Transcript_169720:37-1944(-)